MASKEFAQMINNYMAQRGLSKRQVADSAGIEPSSLSKSMSSKYPDRALNLGHALRLATAITLPRGEMARFVLLSQGLPAEKVDFFLEDFFQYRIQQEDLTESAEPVKPQVLNKIPIEILMNDMGFKPKSLAVKWGLVETQENDN